ncbi:preprotein translocase subunit YajC [Peptoniphilus raoultii]|uniref:preprotein translocase subunit YajC n=1 Tax=Peptoniphilus raoultii TaxID=1776387 RepID=UPI000A5FE6CE
MDYAQLLAQFGPLVLIFVVFYFMIIRPQNKKQNEIKDMRANLKAGDKVQTIGGIVAKIIAVKEDLVVLETSGDKNKLEVMKWGISSVFKDNSELSSDKK